MNVWLNPIFSLHRKEKGSTMTTRESIRRSVLWATYGDALGFITELCSESYLPRRTGGIDRVTGLIPWIRRIGGKRGVQIELPLGCYSDDTQLRLATCRSIRANGIFDVETFSKVELPIWLSYALGAGRSSKAGADSLKKNSVEWHSNFYSSNYAQYINAGGNGAAMRIQPHVWSAQENKKVGSILKDVIRNTITTHGHCRAMVGAAFHALCLRKALVTHKIPSPAEWFPILDLIRRIPEVIQNDDELQLYWLPTWEKETKHTIVRGIGQTVEELRQDIKRANQKLRDDESEANKGETYAQLVKDIGCFDTKNIGSGVKTSLLAAYLSYVFRDRPHEGLVEAVNLLGTDTDTIATMAGAIMGVTANADPPEKVADFEYLDKVSDRLYEQSRGHYTENHLYPDLPQWQPPNTQIDAIGSHKGQLVLQGFGNVKLLKQPTEQGGKYPCLWQWVELDFGQTILAKRRHQPKPVEENSLPLKIPNRPEEPIKDQVLRKNLETEPTKSEQTKLWEQEEISKGTNEEHSDDSISDVSVQPGLKVQILKRISDIEAELTELKALVEQLS